MVAVKYDPFPAVRVASPAEEAKVPDSVPGIANIGAAATSRRPSRRLTDGPGRRRTKRSRRRSCRILPNSRPSKTGTPGQATKRRALYTEGVEVQEVDRHLLVPSTTTTAR